MSTLRQVHAPSTVKLACFTRWEVIRALLSPTLDATRGFPVLPCDPGRLQDLANVGK